MTTGLQQASVPSSLHCDHLVVAKDGTVIRMLLCWPRSCTAPQCLCSPLSPDTGAQCVAPGADSDVRAAKEDNREIFEFLESASAQFGIAFWGPGSGIIHQVVLENVRPVDSMVAAAGAACPPLSDAEIAGRC